MNRIYSPVEMLLRKFAQGKQKGFQIERVDANEMVRRYYINLKDSGAYALELIQIGDIKKIEEIRHWPYKKQ